MEGRDRVLDWLMVEMMVVVVLLFRACIVAAGELKKQRFEGITGITMREMRNQLRTFGKPPGAVPRRMLF
jgi:hypothetical protein